MIESVDDMMVILQQHTEQKPENKNTINLIYKGNQLNELVYELSESGYEPSISYDAGRLISVRLSFFQKYINICDQNTGFIT